MPTPAPSLSPADAIALAKRAPLAQKAVRELAKKIPSAIAQEAARIALDTVGAPPALVLAFVAAAGGAELDPDLVCAILPDVISIDHVGPLVYATKGEILDLCAKFLGTARGDLELECLVMLVAATRYRALSDRGPAIEIPRVLLVRGRGLARHQLPAEASICLGAAASLLEDPALASLAAPHVQRAKRGKKTLEDVIAAARLSPLDALDDAEGQLVSAGFTVRHDGPTVGRNDPCPCGSGKKYKKCCANAATADGAPTTSVSEPRIDPTTVGPDQIGLLAPREIAALETSRLSLESFEEAFVRLCVARQWSLALRLIEEARKRPDLRLSQLTALALAHAREARDLTAVRSFHALLPPDLAAENAFMIACLEAAPDLLARMEQEALVALQGDADGAAGIRFASSLLAFYPALGIYVARGALHERYPNDSQELLEMAEDARDRLLLSPYEGFWDVFDWLAERGGTVSREDHREKKKDKEDAKRAKLKEDLRMARAASRKTAVELEKLQRRVTELDDALVTAPASVRTKQEQRPASPPSPELTEERRRLKTKIDELERIIGEGQEERRELRQKLATREKDGPETEERGPASFAFAAPPSTREPDAEPEGVHDEGAVDLPRAVLIPRFADRAAKAVAELATDPADTVLSVIAGLAAGRPNAWSGVKQLTRIRGVLSARAGIHHRVLFAVGDGSLDVLEVLHRKDLEQVVARLARAS